jgi:two-component system, OmpR family, sensor histidine kinase KdpD
MHMKSSDSPRIRNRAARLFVCLGLVGAIAYAGFSVLHVNTLIAGFAYMLVVLVVAAHWGLLESIATSLAATLCLNVFFIPPVLSLTIADPLNWVALFAFLVTAITASQLSASARQRAREAQDRRAEVERLYELSRSLLLLDRQRELGLQIAERVKDQFGFSSVAYCDGFSGRIDFAGAAEADSNEEALHNAARGEGAWFVWRKDTNLKGQDRVVVPVTVRGQTAGSLGATGAPVSEPALRAIANLVGITLERAREQAAFARMEAARQNERLKSVLLDALAHDFITPLTSIKGAITTVRSEFRHDPEEDDFLAVVEEETDKLNGMVNETIDMARVETGQAQLRPQLLAVSDLIRASIARMASLLDARVVDVQLPERISPVKADPDLMSLALRQLLGNAAKYSPPSAKIVISASESDGMITIRVLDEGPGIPATELEAIFERFYRGTRAHDSVPGTGMGLSIAREIVQAHQGRLWAENRPGGGAQFSLTLPAAQADVVRAESAPAENQ